MTHYDDIQQWLESLFSSIDTKNNEHFSSFLTDDINFRFANMPTTIGKSAVRHQVNDFFGSIKSLKHTIEEFWKHENSIICHGTVCYTRHDNSTLQVPFSNIFKLDDRLIKDYLIFADVSELY